MTENLLQKLEEKVTSILVELESLRKELHHAKQENAALKSEMSNSTHKLQGLVSLLDTMDAHEPAVSLESNFIPAKEEIVA